MGSSGWSDGTLKYCGSILKVASSIDRCMGMQHLSGRITEKVAHCTSVPTDMETANLYYVFNQLHDSNVSPNYLIF